MKYTIIFFSLFLTVFPAFAQQKLVYQSYFLGSDSGDTTFRVVERFDDQLKI